MTKPASTAEYGTDKVTVPKIDSGMFEQKYEEYNARIPTRLLNRFYMHGHFTQVTTAGSTYIFGIVPIDGYIVAIKHVCKTVTAAATVEIIDGSNSDIMTAQSAANTLQSAVLGASVANVSVSQGDILTLAVATALGDLADLTVLVVIQPKY